MRKSVIGLVSLVAPAILGAAFATGCSEDPTEAVGGAFEDLCGPCGTVVTGDVGISGNAKVDGFFAAVASLNNAYVTINGDFEARIDELIAVWEVEVAANASLEAKITALKLEINTQIMASVTGGLTVNYVPARCEANVNVAVSAQAQCEAKAGCDVEVDPGEVSVSCEGTCEGTCEGMCTGGLQCDLSAGGTCEGQCSGSCEMMAATCEGTCRGMCGGECQARDAMGQCAGKCEGMCTGTCELAASAECTGTCTGSCKITGSAMCEGEEPKCAGSCMGTCTGSCKGKATPPSASANCEAEADCQAQASAQASANIACTPPSLDIGFTFNATVSANAQAKAEFTAKMNALRVAGVGIVQGFGRLTALIDGEVNGEVVFPTPPLVQVQDQIEVLVEAGLDGELFADIPIGRAECAFDAFGESVRVLGTMATQAGGTIEAQTDFVLSLTTGDFSS